MPGSIFGEKRNKRKTKNQVRLVFTTIFIWFTKTQKGSQDRYAHLGSRVSPKTRKNEKFGERGISLKNGSLKLTSSFLICSTRCVAYNIRYFTYDIGYVVYRMAYAFKGKWNRILYIYIHICQLYCPCYRSILGPLLLVPSWARLQMAFRSSHSCSLRGRARRHH